MLAENTASPRELSRMDIKNRKPLSASFENSVLEALTTIWPRLDALLVLDQVSEANCGVVTHRIRDSLQSMGENRPDRLILADSRERIGEFRACCLKPNERECRQAAEGIPVEEAAALLARRVGRAVFCTQGDKGMLVAEPGLAVRQVPSYPVAGPIDPVGAGDSTSAGIASALASGHSFDDAAAFGNLVASITIKQLGTTGTATPEQIRERWQNLSAIVG